MNLFRSAKDPVSSYTHFLGAAFSMFATIAMLFIYNLKQNTDVVVLVAILLFGLSLMALYSASSIYHYARGSAHLALRLRKLDHAMIYVLIAGSYTPFCAKFFAPDARTAFLIGIWGVAILGIVVKLLWLDAPRWLYTGLYILMGWAVLFDLDSFSGVPLACLGVILLGGLSYTAGGIIYILKKPSICDGFGFHEIFHILIMLGSAFHIAAVVLYVL